MAAPKAAGRLGSRSSVVPFTTFQLPDHLRRIAVDFHETLEVKGEVPLAHKEWWRTLIQLGFVPWILSYIGEQGEFSQQRRQEVKEFRTHLCEYLGLSLAWPEGPTVDGVFLKICDKKTRNKSGPWNCGKAWWAHTFESQILVDDSADVCAEAELAGIVPYHIRTGRGSYRPVNFKGEHPSCDNLRVACSRIVNDVRTGALQPKSNECRSKSTLNPPKQVIRLRV